MQSFITSKKNSYKNTEYMGKFASKLWLTKREITRRILISMFRMKLCFISSIRLLLKWNAFCYIIHLNCVVRNESVSSANVMSVKFNLKLVTTSCMFCCVPMHVQLQWIFSKTPWIDRSIDRMIYVSVRSERIA